MSEPKILPITKTPYKISEYYPFISGHNYIYKSVGLIKHIEKRHPECIKYIDNLNDIINYPDYIGINPNESDTCFELIKTFDNNVLVGIKLDTNNDYLYVATLYTITDSKLEHGIENGRLKKIDK